jgi:hypothetical protein
MSKQDVQWVSENEEMDLVERSAPSEMKKEIVHGVGARNVGAQTTQDNFALPFGKKLWMMLRTWTNTNHIRESLRMSWP